MIWTFVADPEDLDKGLVVVILSDRKSMNFLTICSTTSSFSLIELDVSNKSFPVTGKTRHVNGV